MSRCFVWSPSCRKNGAEAINDGGVPPRRLAVRPPVSGVEDEHVGLLPPVGRLVDAVDLEDRVGVPLPVEAHPFADQEMRPHELHGAVVILQMFMPLTEFTSSRHLSLGVDLQAIREFRS